MQRIYKRGVNGAALCLVLTVIAVSAKGSDVFVPGNALGNFGNPSCCNQPFVPAISVHGPGTITVTYLDGRVTDAPGINAGPEGVVWNGTGNQFPLQEAQGLAGGPVNNLDGLIGNFAPRWRISAQGFQAVDGTKGNVRVGLLPSELIFIGSQRTIAVKEAGTLFLGINDDHGGSNGGGFTVSVTFNAAN